MIVLNNALLRDYVEYTGHPRPLDGQLHILGLRGCRRYPLEGQIAISLVEPIPNSYDDMVGYFGPKLGIFPGTLDPGRFYSQYPKHPGGCAHTVLIDEKGGTPFNRVIGSHKGKPALVQGSGKVVIWRDTDRDMVQDTVETPYTATGIGINLHKMGHIRNDIGKWSAGCWGVMDKYWEAFWEGATVPTQSNYVNYGIDAWKFAHWFDHERS